MQTVKDYWRLILAGVFVLVGGIYIQFANGQQDALLVEQKQLDARISELQQEVDKPPLSEADLEEEVKVIERTSNHARDMGQEMIAVQKTLATFYRTHEPLDPNEDLTPVRDAEKVYTRLTSSTDYGNTWLLNPSWTMKLDTVADYSSTNDVPVVFSMYTGDGKLAGLVRGIYDAEADFIDAIQIDYTVDGRNDMADVGGH